MFTTIQREFTTNRHQQCLRKETKNLRNNKFKVATTPDTATLEYYQSIYTHCKQRFNIPDEIEVVKKSVYQYIENCINNYLFGNYNISEVRSNLYNNLVHYSHLETEDLNSETLATYFQELNFNIIEYCEEKYPVQSKYSFDFESETETSNKGKQKLKQYSKTTPNTLILPKTTVKYLQTPEQGTKDFTLPRSPTKQQEPFQTSFNLLDFLAKNQSEHSETVANEENDSEISEKKSIDSKNKEDKMTAYITKIPEFNGEDIKTSLQEWLDQVTKAGDANGWNAARMLRTILYFLKRTTGKWFENLTISFNNWTAFKTVFLEQFTDNNTSITLRNCFRNIKQKPSESVMTYIEKFNKLFRRICQLETNDYYSDAQILDQFITGLKDKLIKKVCPHAPEDLNSAIQHAKRYEMAIEEANHTKLRKLTNLQRKSKTILPTNNNSNPKNINYLKDRIKTTSYHSLITSLRIAITVEFLATEKKIAESYNETNKTGVINLTIHQDHNIKPITINLLHSQCNNSIDNPFNITKTNPNNQLILRNLAQPRPTHYHTQSSYLTISEEQDFHHTALSEARIAKNANLSDIFLFEFKANKSPFLFSNAATNKQKTITAIYTEAEVEGKAICLILNSGSTRSIITYQLMQQLKKNVDQPAQTVIITADGMKKTPVGEIDNFFSCNRHSLVSSPSNAKLDWETKELQISYQGQHARVLATCGTFNKCSEKAPAFEFKPEEEKPIIETFMALGSMSNWAEETEQEHFTPHSKPKTPG
ncbi:hypothetical protein G9A89_013025 [Geosiphon pyriformis]|nr:hypothetical protein G9A89_013025 [Geosiphon pyriformis]